MKTGWLWLVLGLCLAQAVAAQNLVKNPAFEAGLAGWDLAGKSWEVECVPVSFKSFRYAVKLSASAFSSETGVASQAIPVKDTRRYWLSGWVKALAGTGNRYKLACKALDARGEHLAYCGGWTGRLVGGWQHHLELVTLPAGTRYVKVLLGVKRGCSALMTGLALEPAETSAWIKPLAVDLFCPQVKSFAAPWPVRVRVENRGLVPLRAISGVFQLPKGIRGKASFTLAELPRDASRTFTFYFEGAPEKEGDYLVCTVQAQQGKRKLTATARTRPFLTCAVPQVTATSHLSPPQAPETRLKLGCYYFPVMLDWSRAGWGVRHVPYLEPLLGYYDEALPSVADWHIKWAVEHGLSFFVFDWYYNQGFTYLNDALEKGFLQSRFADRMQFCLDWCNEGHCTEFKPLDFSDESLAEMLRYMETHYFRRPNYLRIHGKPVLFIHQPWRLAAAHGGWKGCAKALARLRKLMQSWGEPGLYLVAVHNSPFAGPYAEGGFDCLTAYAYGACGVPQVQPQAMDYEAIIPRHREAFALARHFARQQGLDYIPSAWLGWDDNARSKERAVRTLHNTPEAVRRELEALPDFVDERLHLALIEAWNEWGEGGALEPGKPYGFGYLEAVRDVFCKQRGAIRTPVPSAAEVKKYETSITWRQVNTLYYERYAKKFRAKWLQEGFKCTFDSPHTFWLRPNVYIRDWQIAKGALCGHTEGDDPFLLSPPALDLPTSQVAGVRFRLLTTCRGEGQLFWLKQGDSTFSEAQSVKFALNSDGRFHTYTLGLQQHEAFKGTIYQFRLDLGEGPGRFALDYFETIPARN